MGGEEHHSIASPQYGCYLLLVGDVADHQLKPLGQLFIARGEVVINDDVVSPAAQNSRCVTSDVPSSSYDENGHASSCSSGFMIKENRRKPHSRYSSESGAGSSRRSLELVDHVELIAL